MRLIGRPELLSLGADLRGAACSLAAELEAASWESSDDARKAFPNARIADDRIVVHLDDRHCVELALIYEKGVAMVLFAGPSATMKSVSAAKSGRRA
jgi:hypothetical protein